MLRAGLTATGAFGTLFLLCALALHAPQHADGADAGPTLQSRLRGAFLGAVVGDAMCLGTHYEYDAAKIDKAYDGKFPDRYMSPGEHMGGMTHGVGWGQRNYHQGKTGGEQTDYGDYNALLLEFYASEPAHCSGSLQSHKASLVKFWQHKMKTWRGWMCTQTRQTLQQVASGVPDSRLGGMSNAMAVRHAAALSVYPDEASVAAAARTIMFTHRNEEALGGGEFVARVSYRVAHQGLSPVDAIRSVMADPSTSPWFRAKVQLGLDKAAESLDPSSALHSEPFADDLALTSMARLWEVGKSEPIKVGKASPTEGTLPGAVYFVSKYGDLLPALRANAMVGGDNASRAVAIGSILGAWTGEEGIPAPWRDGLTEWARYTAWLDKLPLANAYGKDEL